MSFEVAAELGGTAGSLAIRHLPAGLSATSGSGRRHGQVPVAFEDCRLVPIGHADFGLASFAPEGSDALDPGALPDDRFRTVLALKREVLVVQVSR
jgi:hypothetical protein